MGGNGILVQQADSTSNEKVAQKSTDRAAHVDASPDSFNVTQSDTVSDPDGIFIGITHLGPIIAASVPFIHNVINAMRMF